MEELFMSFLGMLTLANLWWLFQKVVVLWLMLAVVVLGLVVINIINLMLWKAVQSIKEKSLHGDFLNRNHRIE